MALDVAYAINGMPLDTDCFHVTVGSTFLAGITVRRTVNTVPGRHGSVRSGMLPRFDERQLTIRALAHDDNSDAMARRFLHLCSMPSLTVTRSMTAMYGGDEGLPEQSTPLQLTSLQPDGDERPFKSRRRMTAVFAMTDVFWHATPITRPIGASGRILPGAITVPVDDSHPQGLATLRQAMPDDYPSILFDRLTDGWMGDAPITDPIIRLTAPSHATAADPVSGTGITWSGSANGQFLYIDPLHLHAWLASSDSAWSGGSDVSQGLDFPSEPLEIWPAVDNSYSLSIDTNGTAPTIRFSPSWW
ncbi:MAG: hypothetical protein SOI13_04395 [Bifidobacterium mongoliense]|jgi:hypothetical protein|uniref:hypothetical protein n=1 Tax=Bifidobacterium mongoliense TaxID=518643 RepID=UPI002F35E6A9